MNKVNNPTKKGFTLIELLVVIAIIGILSAIGLVSLNGAREKARDAQRLNDLAQYRTAVQLYYDDNNFKYPPQFSGTETLGNCVAGNNTGWLDASFSGSGFLPVSGIFNYYSIFVTTAGKLITTYLAAQLLPPTSPVGAAPAGKDVYCYDTNGSTVNDYRNGFLLYTRLESTGVWHYINHLGDSRDDPQPHLGSACISTGLNCLWL
ncbi:MAG: type II secretion system protein [Patescibacteria group bacterium]